MTKIGQKRTAWILFGFFFFLEKNSFEEVEINSVDFLYPFFK